MVLYFDERSNHICNVGQQDYSLIVALESFYRCLGLRTLVTKTVCFNSCNGVWNNVHSKIRKRHGPL